MKITLDIPDKTLKDLCKHAKTSVKNKAILSAINEYNQRHRLEKLAGYLGTFEGLISKSDLKSLRNVVAHGKARSSPFD